LSGAAPANEARLVFVFTMIIPVLYLYPWLAQKRSVTDFARWTRPANGAQDVHIFIRTCNDVSRISRENWRSVFATQEDGILNVLLRHLKFKFVAESAYPSGVACARYMAQSNVQWTIDWISS